MRFQQPQRERCRSTVTYEKKKNVEREGKALLCTNGCAFCSRRCVFREGQIVDDLVWVYLAVLIFTASGCSSRFGQEELPAGTDADLEETLGISRDPFLAQGQAWHAHRLCIQHQLHSGHVQGSFVKQTAVMHSDKQQVQIHASLFPLAAREMRWNSHLLICSELILKTSAAVLWFSQKHLLRGQIAFHAFVLEAMSSL